MAASVMHYDKKAELLEDNVLYKLTDVRMHRTTNQQIAFPIK
jgi:hypothetical protein